jgi:hypothetical protein
MKRIKAISPKRVISKLALTSLALVLVGNLVFSGMSKADFNPSNLIDDQVFDNTSSMSAGQVNTFLNSFSGSCISPNHGFQAQDPTGYSPNGGFTYGASVTAGQVIVDAAQTYGLNPQVLLTTLEKEQSLVTGGAGCSTLRYVGAAGYGCPDGGTTYSYSGLNLYSINGAMTTSVSGTCVNSASKVGFSEQVIHAAWLLKFGEQRSQGNINWNVQLTNSPQSGDVWNDSDDPQSCYGGPMTQGTFQICPGGSSTYYDGYYTIDGSSINIGNGATASLYWYTPHFSGNQSFDSIFTNWFGSLSSCDYPKGASQSPPNIYGNAHVISLPGNWSSTSAQGFAYATPNYSGGFDVAVMSPSTNGLVWQGVWWSQTNPSIDLENTVFIPAKDSNGLTDLYYATSTNWSKPGFTVGLMHNNGHSFSYGGTQWVTSSLSLANTKFIPGNFSPGSGSQGFAYATPNYSGGFDVAVMSPSTNGLVWQGIKWSQTNGQIDLGNTVLIPADTDNDGLTDLYYATSPNWSIPGFNVGLMHNNGGGLTYGGPQWTSSNLNLGTMTFLPGNWGGSSNGQGFAYTTACGSRGFDMSVMAPSGSGLVWQGQWWQASTLPLTSTDFIPADEDGDGYTDLYYVTTNGNYGFSVALQHNNGSGGGFNWQGLQWVPATIPLTTTTFLPSN